MSSRVRVLREQLARRPRVFAFAFYLIAATLMFARPVLAHPARDCICVGTSHDPGIFAWAMQWWPHALLHGLNPFYTHLLYAPVGINLAHGQLVPGAALLLAPITAAVGPIASYNLAMLLSPVLAAYFTFGLCRRLTGALWPSLLGGWLFGFSTYMLGQLTGHLHLTLIFLVPAIVHLTVVAVQDGISRRRYVLLLGAALSAQFAFSTELLLSLTLFGGLALALGYALAPPTVRHGLRRVIPAVAGGYALMALVVSPYLYFALRGGGIQVLAPRAEMFSNDLLGFAFPTDVTRLGRRYFAPLSFRFTAGVVEGAAYLGLPLLGIMAAYGVTEWRRRRAQLLLALFGLIVLASLGARLHVAGVRTIPLPWSLFDELPLVGAALPGRFIAFGGLAAAVMAALWLAGPARHPRLRWGLAALAVIALLPNWSAPYWHGRPYVPAFFSGSTHKRYVSSRDTVLILPISIAGNAMLWHAQAGLDFRMAGGYTQPPEAPDPYKGDPIYPALTYFARVPDAVNAARRFIASKRIDAIVLEPHDVGPWPGWLAAMGLRPRAVGGVLLYRVTPMRT